MSLPAAIGTTTIEIEGLGTVKGNVYPGGIRQFCGIPYGYLKKRWTRSVLKTSWEDKGNFHDGTHLGYVYGFIFSWAKTNLTDNQ